MSIKKSLSERQREVLQSLKKLDPFVRKFTTATIHVTQKSGKITEKKIESINELIKAIPAHELKKTQTIETYAQHIREKRNQLHLSQEEVAIRFDVARTTIEKEESGKEKKKVDPFYLECHSLLYQVSPLYLIGMTQDEHGYDFEGLTTAVVPVIKAAVQAAELIIYNSYQTDWGSPEINIKFLDLIMTICRLPPKKRSLVKMMLLTSPEIQRLSASVIREKGLGKLKNYHKNNSKIYNEMDELISFGNTDLSTLKLLAHLTEADDSLKAGIRDFIKAAGYLE